MASKKFRYRLYADETIIDLETGKVAGYITNKYELDEVWKMNNLEKQQYVKKIATKEN